MKVVLVSILQLMLVDATPRAIPTHAGGAASDQNNAAGPLNVRDYGATGAGKVADSAAIQRAIDAAQDNSTRGAAGPLISDELKDELSAAQPLERLQIVQQLRDDPDHADKLR